MKSRFLILLAAGALLGLAPVPSIARGYCRAVPYGIYQSPDGTYDSLADLVRDVRGTPCGVECTRAAMARWSRWAHRCAG